MKRVALADVLWDAANEHLSDALGFPGESYSCHAVFSAVKWDGPMVRKIESFFAALGCDPNDAYSFGVTSLTKRQGARYMWLLLAMHVAEDEGIYIEVER